MLFQTNIGTSSIIISDHVLDTINSVGVDDHSESTITVISFSHAKVVVIARSTVSLEVEFSETDTLNAPIPSIQTVLYHTLRNSVTDPHHSISLPELSSGMTIASKLFTSSQS